MKAYALLALAVFFAIPRNAFSQIPAPETEWELTFQERDIYYCVETSDGNYIAVGHTTIAVEGIHPPLCCYFLIVKIDRTGKVLWEKVHDILPAYFISEKNNGYICLIYYNRIVHLTADGEIESTFPIIIRDDLFPNEKILKKESAIIFTGRILEQPEQNRSQVYFMKTDFEGNKIIENSFGLQGENVYGDDIIQTADGGYIIVGHIKYKTDDVDDHALYVVKTDSAGKMMWERKYERTKGLAVGRSIEQTSDGGYIILATSDTQQNDYDYLLIKTNNSGLVEWKKFYGCERHDEAIQLLLLPDNSYIVIGFTLCGQKSVDSLITRISSSGEIVWEKRIQGRPESYPYSIQSTSDGGYIFTASRGKDTTGRGKDGYIMKLARDMEINIRTPKKPKVTVHMISNTAAKVEWEKQNTVVAKYTVEKKFGRCTDWESVGELAGDRLSFQDAGLPPHEEICYRISASNDFGSSGFSDPACVTTPNTERWQLKIYSSSQDKFVDLFPCDGQFRPEYGTAVIVHGWQPFGEFLSPLDDWILTMARAIYQRIGSGVNIIAWDWIDEAVGNLHQVALRVDKQAKKFASSSIPIFTQNRSKPLHFIGHSLGNHIVILLAGYLGNVGRLPEQITLLDTPDAYVGLGQIDSNLGILRKAGTYIDSYAGCANLGTHHANIWVNIPCFETPFFCTGISLDPDFLKHCHIEPNRWYTKTVPIEGKPVLFDRASCFGEFLDGNIGFGASILLSPEDLKRMRVKSSCKEKGTLMFSELTICSIGQGKYFGLDNARECRPIHIPNITSGIDPSISDFSFFDGLVWSDSRCFCHANSTEAFLSTKKSGQGGGAGIEEGKLIARLEMPIDIQAEHDYFSFEYDFPSDTITAELEVSLALSEGIIPLFLMPSETVLNQGYLESGLKDMRSLHGKIVTLRIDLKSSQKGDEVTLRNFTFWKDALNDNQPPTAHAGKDQFIKTLPSEKAVTTLDASQSLDPDLQDLLQYWWFLNGELLASGIRVEIELPLGVHTITLQVRDSADHISTDEIIVTVVEKRVEFVRGDSNTDSEVDISDAITILFYLFLDHTISCRDTADTNDNGLIDISDALLLFIFLFKEGPLLPQPYPLLGSDPTTDGLECAEYLVQ